MMILPAQVQTTMEEFKGKSSGLANFVESDEEALCEKIFNFHFSHEETVSDKKITIQTRIYLPNRYVPKTWRQYFGPKGVEIMLIFPQTARNTALQYLDELMKKLKLQEYQPGNEFKKTSETEDVPREILIQEVREIDIWYDKIYKRMSQIEQTIDQALKHKAL